MWIWWIISLIVLIACFIFAYKMIASSYESMPSGKKNFLRFNKSTTTKSEGRTEIIYELKSHLKKMEENASLYEIQFSKLQQRLKVLEGEKEKRQVVETVVQTEQTEDWKEMYYEENAVKEKLENELDYARQMLEETENKLKTSSETSARWVKLQSEYDARQNDLHSLQDHIDLLNRQLEASAEREKELEQLLLSEITLREKYSLLQRKYTELNSEADDLKRRITELNKKDSDLQLRVIHLNELESRLALCEEEKIRLKTNLEKLL